MRQVVGGRAVDAQAASASQMGRFETETLTLPENRAALADLSGEWIDRASATVICMTANLPAQANKNGSTRPTAALKM